MVTTWDDKEKVVTTWDANEKVVTTWDAKEKVVTTWDAKEKVGRGEIPFFGRAVPPAAWDPFLFRRLFAGLVASDRTKYFAIVTVHLQNTATSNQCC